MIVKILLMIGISYFQLKNTMSNMLLLIIKFFPVEGWPKSSDLQDDGGSGTAV